MADLLVCCQTCDANAAEVPSGKLSLCGKCKAVSYCSRECQLEDWREHKLVCKHLNHGDAQQTTHPDHLRTAALNKGTGDAILQDSHQNPCLFACMTLFLKSKDETDHTDTLAKMKHIFLRQTKYNKNAFLFGSLTVLIGLKKAYLRLPTSPLLLVLQYEDANVLNGRDGDQDGSTALHWIAEMNDPNKRITYSNQVFLAKQLLEHGANVNARAAKAHARCSPLFRACHSAVATNLELIQLFLDHGADPNLPNDFGETPLMCTLTNAPGAAKFLLEYSS
jgi:ankyrin repeat protein